MATEERLPPTCAFAISVLADRDVDPEAVPEEAIEAAQHHMATCSRCVNASRSEEITSTASTTRKRKKVRRVAETQPTLQNLLKETSPLLPETEQAAMQDRQTTQPGASTSSTRPDKTAEVALVPEDTLDCQQCRQLLPEYAEALDSNQDVGLLYPEVQAHLLSCESGCLVLLDFFQQEARATRKFRRRPVRDPFSAIGWELSGFFRSGQIPMAPKALAYGTLMLLLLIASLGIFSGYSLDERIHYASGNIPTPDGVGFSDGLKVFDACNSSGYQNKRDAANALQILDLSRADSLLATAMKVVQADTAGCNGAEAAIYRENLHVRQSRHPFAIEIVSFDSGPGNADPQGGSDRHILYGAYTQELAGAYIGQQQYNAHQMKIAEAPLLYLVLANTTGVETGALQIVNAVAQMAQTHNLQPLGLLINGTHPFLGMLGPGPSSLTQVILPTMCRVGIPLIAPTSTGLFVIDQLTQSSLFRHCAPGFGFVRFSPDDATQSALGATYAYNTLHARNAAVFYDPSNPSSRGSYQGFVNNFTKNPDAHIVANEMAAATGLLDANGRPQTSHSDLQAELHDALQANPRPDLIFAPLLANDVTTLAEGLARLPADQQPALLIGGEFVQPAVLQKLAQWTRQHQLSLPPTYVTVATAARQPGDEDWQRQFYGSFCTSFATPGSFCSGAGALDQGALLFGDSIELLTRSLGSATTLDALPTREQLVKNMAASSFTGVSFPIVLHLNTDFNMITSETVQPTLLGIQQDGNIQIVN